jgi:hypothetical protein
MSPTVQDYINNANASYQQIQLAQQTKNMLLVTQLINEYNYYIQQAEIAQIKNKKFMPHYKSIFIPAIMINNYMPTSITPHRTMKNSGFRYGTRKKRTYRRTRSYKK